MRKRTKYTKIKKNIILITLCLFSANLIPTTAFASNETNVDTLSAENISSNKNINKNTIKDISLNKETKNNSIESNKEQNIKPKSDVNIVDDNLRAVINQTLGQPLNSTITSSQMLQLTSLNAADRNIKNLSGLGSAKNLRKLYLNNNSIVNIKPLSNLSNLTELNLSNNKIYDLIPLGKLTKLNNLNLSSNKIDGLSSSSLSPLSSLDQLTTLDLSNNEIINETNITTLDPLRYLTKLSHLNLSNNRITDINPLSKLRNSNLNTLILDNNHLTNVSVLSRGFSGLKELSLNNTGLTNLIGLRESELSGLKSLYLRNNGLTTIPDLYNLKNLALLDLSNNKISDLSNINGRFLPADMNLKTLDLSNNLINDLSPLEQNDQLEPWLAMSLDYLNLSSNKITNIEPIAEFLSASAGCDVNLDNNQISDISILDDSILFKYDSEVSILNQRINLLPEEYNIGNTFTMKNTIIGPYHKKVTNISVLPNGYYNSKSENVTWTDLASGKLTLRYKWNETYKLGYRPVLTIKFSGTATKKIIQLTDPTILLEIPSEIKMSDLKDDNTKVGAKSKINLKNTVNFTGGFKIYTEPIFYVSEVGNNQNKVPVKVYKTKDKVLGSSSTPLMTLDKYKISQDFFIKAKKSDFTETNKKYTGTINFNIEFIN